MFSRVAWIYRIYAAQHSERSLPAQRIGRINDPIPGYLEQVVFKDGFVRLRGWCLCDQIVFRSDRDEIVHAPTGDRQDVSHSHGCDPNVGFEAALLCKAGPVTVELHRGNSSRTLEIRVPKSRGALPVILSLLSDLLRGAPQILNAALFQRHRLKTTVKSALKLIKEKPVHPLDLTVLTPAPNPCPSTDKTITIILPVFNAFDILQDCLARIRDHTDVPWRMILIEDASTDPRVRNWVRNWVDQINGTGDPKVTLVLNDQNQGFVASVNLGLDQASAFGGPVILLNSDALVPKNWASRLLAPMLANPKVASVTPMSNHAQIFSAPVICADSPLAPGQVDMIDQAAQDLQVRSSPSIAPTGVGFCMAISPTFLKMIGGFDPMFSPGYGEEVDWCNRASAAGGRHVAATNLFVEHCGGCSFGTDQKQELLKQHSAEISRRYPNYDMQVRHFIRDDPLLTERLVLALAYLGSHPKIDAVPVFIAHSMGGGAEKALRQRMASDHAEGAVVLRFGGAFRCVVEVHTATGVTKAATNSLADASALMVRLSRKKIIYSCAVGDPDPVEIPAFITALRKGHTLEIQFHDFFPLSPSYTLLDHDHVFRGAPIKNRNDKAHRLKRTGNSTIALKEWQSAWSQAVQAAHQLTVFSADSRSHVTKVYPNAQPKLRIMPHEIPETPRPIIRSRTRSTTIGVLGNIGIPKGSEVLTQLSKHLRETNDVKLVVLGRVDQACKLHGNAKVHGGYAIEDIPALIKRYGITTWLIPSIWPETFSFTTHEALATGLPVITFDIGAQAEAARAAPNGIVLPGTPETFLSDEMTTRIIQTARDPHLTVQDHPMKPARQHQTQRQNDQRGQHHIPHTDIGW